MDNEILNKIKFIRILSNDTVYGLIWDGEYQKKRCVIKMIMISDKHAGKRNITHDDCAPFIHTQFIDKKSMLQSNFLREVSELIQLSNFQMAPQFYGYTIYEKSSLRYGFIVMKKMDHSLKDIIMNRSLMKYEEILIKSTIQMLHNKYKIVHGDLKPSNIGIDLDENGYIYKCLLFDCQKVKHKKDYSRKTFNKLIKKDLDKYKEHFRKNIKVDCYK